MMLFFFFSSVRRHTRLRRDWSSDVCSSDLYQVQLYSPSLAMPSWSEHQDFTVRSLDESLRDETDCAIFFNPKCIPYRYLAKSPATHKVIYFLLNGGHYRQSYQRWIDRTQRLPDIVLAGNNGRWRTHYKLRSKQGFDLIGGIDIEHFRPPVVAPQPKDKGEQRTKASDLPSSPREGIHRTSRARGRTPSSRNSRNSRDSLRGFGW